MRGILTLAAAASIPETTTSGAPFPGREQIQVIALVLTLGTLLLQGTTLRFLIRALRLDTTAENQQAKEMRARADRIVAQAAAGVTDEDFERQRAALSRAMMNGEIDEDTARELIGEIDLRQAAQHTLR